MKKAKQVMQVGDGNNTPMVSGMQNCTYAEKRLNKKTGALVETIKTQSGVVAQRKKIITGGQVTSVITLPRFSSKAERDDSIRDFAKNGINQQINALAHDVAQSTVSYVLNKKKSK